MTLLSSKKIHDVKRNIKMNEKQFDQADRKKRRQKTIWKKPGASAKNRAKFATLLVATPRFCRVIGKSTLRCWAATISDDENNKTKINEDAR
jgi:hypothetical protein